MVETSPQILTLLPDPKPTIQVNRIVDSILGLILIDDAQSASGTLRNVMAAGAGTSWPIHRAIIGAADFE